MKQEIPVWHSLMYSTGYLLLICGIPGVLAAAVVFVADGTLAPTGAVHLVAYMGSAVVLIALALLSLAKQITNRQKQHE